MDVVESIAKNTGLQLIGKIISLALGWSVVLLMTNALGANGFGEYTIMTAYLQFFGVAADFGLVLVSSQLLAERPAERTKIFNNLLSFRLVTAAAILALAPILIWFFPYSILVKQGVAILTLSYLLAAIMQIFTGLNQAELTMGRVVWGEIWSRIILLAVITLAVATGQGLALMLVGVVAAALVNLLWLIYKLPQTIKFTWQIDFSLWRDIWSRAWPLIATILLNLIYLKADTIILSLTRSLTEVGIYGAVYRVFEVLITVPTMFASLLLPVVSAARIRGDITSMKQLANRGFELMAVSIFPMIVLIMFLAQPIVRLFGQEFLGDGPALLKLLVLANAAVFLGTYFAHLVVAGDQQKKMIWPFGLTAVVAIIGYAIFIPLFGAYGAAAMTVVAESLIAVLAYRVLSSHTPMAIDIWQPLFKCALAILPMLMLGLTNFFPLFFSLGFGLALYVVILIVFDGLPKLTNQEIKII